ncbi:heme biosynthesis protein HemY [Maritalea sp.]|uniref:heme biosynthesis protein HemY n=1 Tax=Maritalea sp. TaxID=2003361 RepID=UPI003EF84F80
MIRMLLVVAISLAIALGASWIISLPGNVTIEAFGYQMQPGLGLTIFGLVVLVLVTIFVWAILRRIFGIPALFSRVAAKRKQNRGVDALSNAIIALQTGDPARAKQLAREARVKLGGNSAAQLLEAQASVDLGNWSDAREQYREMIANPDTAIAALSGLYEQATRQNRTDAALKFAQKAVTLAPKLEWASQAVFDDLTKNDRFEEALEHLANMPTSRADKAKTKRMDGVLRTAIAKQTEDSDPDKAIQFATEALKRIPEFVPAALIAARIYINRGEVRKASGLLRRVWRANPHPHIALLYANAQPGASAVERLKRTKSLVSEVSTDLDAQVVLATAAVEAHEWDLARAALQPFVDKDPTQSVCTLMAQIEQGQTGDQGKARAWLGRAITAHPDNSWIGDGISSDEWEPTSPLSGKLDSFEWKMPQRAVSKSTTSREAPVNNSEPKPDALDVSKTALIAQQTEKDPDDIKA